MKEQSTDR